MITTLAHDRCVLLHGDCTGMETVLAPKSVDLIVTDPPYGEHTHRNLGKEKRKDGTAPRDALTFAHLTNAQISELAVQFVRLCRGWILIFTDDRSVTAWGEAIEAAGGRWVRTGHWVKSNPMPQMSGDRPAVGTEPLVICHGEPKGRMVWNGGGHAAVYRGPGDKGAGRVHPNQKPLWLMQELVKLFAPPGAMVLDPFTGSGSTGVAALAEGFDFVGIERDPNYVLTAKARLEGALGVASHVRTEP